MSIAAEKNSFQLSARRSHGRVINAVADLLRRTLSVPEIYLEPKIAAGYRPDVLAADKAGSGDLHAVEIKILTVFPTRTWFRDLTSELKLLPFHFKYLAIPSFGAKTEELQRLAGYPEFFDASGIGRIGVISFDHRILEPSGAIDSSSASLTVRPERFRVSGQSLAPIEKFLGNTSPDISVRI
jgi:hypothetical protein